MRTSRRIGLAATLLLAANLQAQWLTTGNTVTTGDYLGGNAFSVAPLLLKTVANQPIDFSTSAVFRAWINKKLTSAMGPLNEFPVVPRDGFMMLSGTADAFTNTNSRAPFTRLHLVDNAVSSLDPTVYAQQHGFRPWQRNGITFTGNSDQAYIGQKYGGDDNTDFVVQWSDNPGGSPWGTDRMKFVFTTQYVPGALRGATTTTIIIHAYEQGALGKLTTGA